MSKMIHFPKPVIDKIIDDSETVHDAFLALYKFAIPAFDQAKQIAGYPLISSNTAEYCLEKLHQKTTDPWEVNSFWLNKGFSSSDNIPDWKISSQNLTLTF